MTTDKTAITPAMQADLDAIDAALAGRSSEASLSDLGQLALELRDQRAEPDPFFTRELDAKAAAGFPRSRPAGVKWTRWLTPTTLAGSAASMLIVVMVGAALLNGSTDDLASNASGAGQTGTAGTAAGGGDFSADQQAGGREAAKSGGGSSGASTVDESAPQPPTAIPPVTGGSGETDALQRRIQETSASLTLTAPPRQIADVADGVVRVTDALGGFVVSSTVSSTDGEGGGGGGLFEIRVPSAKLQSALAELSKLAHVSERRQAQRDITAEAVSAGDRLDEARAEREALMRRLAAATTDAGIARTKRRLKRVNAQIAAAKADVARVKNRASFSNIAVSLAGDPNAGAPGEDDGQWSPGDAARDALRVLEVIAGVALIALAIGLPLALLALLGAFAARVTARRRRERALDAV